MRIAFFSDTFLPTIDGVVSATVSLARSLKRKGHEVKFFVPRPKDEKENAKLWKDLDICFVGSTSLPTYPSYRVSLPFSPSAEKAFRDFAPDIAHIHTPFSMGWMGLGFARKAKIPIIATYHTLLPEFLMYLPIPFIGKTRLAKDITWSYTRMFFSKADAVTTLTERMARELERNGIKAIVLSNPVRFELFNRFAGAKKGNGELKLLFFGRLSFEKNIEIVLDALKIALEKKPETRLVVIGDGPARETLKRHAREIGVDGKVDFEGILREKDLAREVASCSALVTASTIETQGLTILEAMAAGVPCIGADYLAIPDAVKEGHNGFLFRPHDAASAAEKILRLEESGKLQEKLSKNAIETARQLSEENVVKEYLKLCNKLAGKPEK